MSKALEEVCSGVEAARRILLERREMRADGDGQFRSIREPKPGRTLKATRSAA